MNFKIITKDLSRQKIISYVIILIAYMIAIKIIAYCKSNHKVKSRKLDSMRLFSMLILTGIWHAMVDKSKSKNATILLWTIAACFLYVQAFWEPNFSAIGHKKSGGKIAAWLFHSSHLWEGLAAIPLTYFFTLSVYKTMRLWAIWECFKWGLLYIFYHLEIKKASATGDNLVSFPLGATELLEGALITICGVYGLLHIWLAKNALKDAQQQILCVALLLLGGLCIKIYLSESNIPVPQWVGFLGDLSVSTVAIYYLWHAGGEKPFVGEVSLLLFVLHIFPKWVNLTAKTSLVSKYVPSSVQNIIHIFQYITAFWLQLSIKEALCIVSFALSTSGAIHKTDRLETNIPLYYLLSYLAVALVLHLLLQKGYLGTLNRWTAHTILLYGWGILLGFYIEYTPKNGYNHLFGLVVVLGGGLLVCIPPICAKMMHKFATFSLTFSGMPAILSKIAHAIQGFSSFLLQPNLDVVCTAIVTCMGALIHAYYSQRSLPKKIKKALSFIPLHKIALIFLLYLILEVVVYNFPTQKQLAAFLAHGIFFGIFAYTIEASNMTEDAWGLTLVRLPFFIFCYLTIVVWVQYFLNTMGINSDRKTSLPAFYSIGNEEAYALALGWQKVPILVYMMSDKFPLLSALVFIFTLDTQLSIVLKLSQGFKKHTVIINRLLFYVIFSLWSDDSHDAPKIKLPLILDIVQYLLLPYLLQLFLRVLAFFKSCLFTAELPKQRPLAARQTKIK